ncbi:hypothetical protein Tcan_09909 [Toxocara canis]|uniref:Uncharacterized protein n=2 Tax=Toxocara canis TaxID=6265 RepID=A0A0B2V8R2_TOXCA|nr:hypothetical protein Tcan_09909 [Toxocara canis]VDM48925.1 unnamed protein product [Toxocara canis]
MRNLRNFLKNQRRGSQSIKFRARVPSGRLNRGRSRGRETRRALNTTTLGGGTAKSDFAREDLIANARARMGDDLIENGRARMDEDLTANGRAGRMGTGRRVMSTKKRGHKVRKRIPYGERINLVTSAAP